VTFTYDLDLHQLKKVIIELGAPEKSNLDTKIMKL